jgi:hypothetical protein
MTFAVKRLRKSDLTFFDVQFRRLKSGNQKAINLNRDVFIDLLFPLAPARSAGAPLRFPCEIRIFGPGLISPPRTVMRKVIAAGGTQKNWRLNGETVTADQDAPRPDRYDNLQENDLALFRFEGAEVPQAIDILLVSGVDSEEVHLFESLDGILGSARMRMLTEADLLPLLDFCAENHPIRELIDPELDQVLIEAVQGSAAALAVVRKRGIRRTSHDSLAEAKATAERIGRDGETLVAAYLHGQIAEQKISQAIWESETNATHPFDFTVYQGTEPLKVEVKSTTGEHSRTMMFSQAEIEHAAGDENFEVWRVSNLSAEGGLIRRTKGLPDLARRILASMQPVPGVSPTGWTIAPSSLEPWSESVTASYQDEPDE